MILNDQMKACGKEAPFITLVTVSSTGNPHAIVVGQVKEMRDDDVIVFGIYKMETTQQNIKSNESMQVIFASVASGPKGYRLLGKACVVASELLFKVEKVESLM